VHIFQVDERLAPAGDPARNLAHLRDSLLEHAALSPDHVHAMPVEAAELDRAAEQYARTLRDVAGFPPVLDLIHLGLGPDGHTASLVPEDPVLDVSDVDVAVTGPYQGRRRMTLTFPIINRSRFVLWVVTGGEKAEALVRLRDGDRSIPGSRVRRHEALVLADRAATGRLSSDEKIGAVK
jgi:6-phosphogluconolactonase